MRLTDVLSHRVTSCPASVLLASVVQCNLSFSVSFINFSEKKWSRFLGFPFPILQHPLQHLLLEIKTMILTKLNNDFFQAASSNLLSKLRWSRAPGKWCMLRAAKKHCWACIQPEMKLCRQYTGLKSFSLLPLHVSCTKKPYFISILIYSQHSPKKMTELRSQRIPLSLPHFLSVSHTSINRRQTTEINK